MQKEYYGYVDLTANKANLKFKKSQLIALGAKSIYLLINKRNLNPHSQKSQSKKSDRRRNN
jgi:hypothetical protein